MDGSTLDRLDPAQVGRFRRDLGALVDPSVPIGLAVSGGPDSLALLLLAAAARLPGLSAATVDHGLRPEGPAEAEFVGRLCASLGLPHTILTVRWNEAPQTALQERARTARYAQLSAWAAEGGLNAIATAHHRDDQAETVLMRLARGAGLTGLAAMRPLGRVPASTIRLARPLLGWSRDELAAVCGHAEAEPIQDRSNLDGKFERVRVRQALAQLPFLDTQAIAASAAHLAQADDALAWAVEKEWQSAVDAAAATIVYRPTDAPAEIRRRIVVRAIATLAVEGEANPLRGPEIDRVVESLDKASTLTLRGVLCAGGREWRFTPAPLRRA